MFSNKGEMKMNINDISIAKALYAEEEYYYKIKNINKQSIFEISEEELQEQYERYVELEKEFEEQEMIKDE